MPPYKHVVLGLIFLKYVSDVFAARRATLEALVKDPDSYYYMPTEAARLSILESRDEYAAEGVFWVPEGHRWDDLRKARPSRAHRRGLVAERGRVMPASTSSRSLIDLE